MPSTAQKLELPRELPTNVEGAKTSVQSLGAWIGEAWLSNSQQRHPLREIWQRQDFVAGVELTILGRSYERLKASQPPARLAELSRTLKGSDIGNQIGAAYELTTAAMLDVPGQTVRLLGPQQPAYDVELESKGRTIRISCKALLPAQVEQEFRDFVARVTAQVRLCARSGPVMCFCSLWDQGAGPEHLATTPAIAEAHALWMRDPTLSEFKQGAWWFAFSHLQSEYPHLVLSTRHPSYGLLVAAELSGNEERRLAAKLEEAKIKFRTGGHTTSATVANVVAIRLPPSINLKATAAAINAAWTEDDHDLAGVLVTRVVVATNDFRATSPRFQWQWIENPFAAHPLGEKAFHCDWPVGETLEAIDVGYFMKQGESIQRIERGFVRSVGQVCFEIENPNSLLEREIQFKRVPGTEAYLVLPNGKKLSLNGSPRDCFVLL